MQTDLAPVDIDIYYGTGSTKAGKKRSVNLHFEKYGYIILTLDETTVYLLSRGRGFLLSILPVEILRNF